jgi:ketosteroid isomerase-like protein
MPITVRTIRAANPSRMLAVVAVLACMAAPAAAQDVPGGTRVDPGRSRREYTADALRDYNRFTAEWAEAWRQKDMRALLGRYSANPTILLGDSVVIRGQIELRRFLEKELPEGTEMRLSITDFVAGEGLSYASGAFAYQSTPDATPAVGTYVMVLAQEEGRLKIRSQVFAPAPAFTPAPAPTPTPAPSPAPPPPAPASP